MRARAAAQDLPLLLLRQKVSATQQYLVGNCDSASDSRKGEVLKYRLSTSSSKGSPDPHPLPHKHEPPRSSCLPPARQQPQVPSLLHEAEVSTHFHSATLKHEVFLGIWRSIREPGLSQARAMSTHHLQLRHRATQGPFLAVHKRICRRERRNHQVTTVSLKTLTRILPRSPCSLQAGDSWLFPPSHLAWRWSCTRSGRSAARAPDGKERWS